MTEAALRLQRKIARSLELRKAKTRLPWDPELIYVECQFCGRPVLWEPGMSTTLLQQAGIRPEQLDASCLILSKGCPACRHGEEIFETRVVRLTQTRPPLARLRDAHAWS